MSDCARCATVQREYEEFQEQSAELEAELEKELAAAHDNLAAAKTKLDRAKADLAAERSSSQASLTQLHAQVATLQSELSKSSASLDSLRNSKRSTETSATGLDEKLRRAESFVADAAEKVEQYLEQIVLLKIELDEVRQTAAEQEARMKSQIHELTTEIKQAQRRAHEAGASGDTVAASAAISAAAPAAAAAAAAASSADDSAFAAELASLKEEVALLSEEKTQLNSDIEEVSTDLARVQDENEELVKQLEELKAGGTGGAADGDAAAAAGTPSAEQAEQIAELTAQLLDAQTTTVATETLLTETQLSKEALEAELADLRTESAQQLASLQAELETARAASGSTASSDSAASDAATIVDLRAQLLASRSALSDSQARVAEAEMKLATAWTTAETKLAAAQSKAIAAETRVALNTSIHSEALAKAIVDHASLSAKFNELQRVSTEKEAASAAKLEQLQSQLNAKTAMVTELESRVTRADEASKVQAQQISDLTVARDAQAASHESARLLAASQLADQTAQTKAASSAHALVVAELAESRAMVAASSDQSEKDGVAQRRIAELNQQLQQAQTKLDAAEASNARLAAQLTEETHKLQASVAALESLRKQSAAEASKIREDSAAQLAAQSAELSAKHAEQLASKQAELSVKQAELEAARSSNGSSASAADAALAESTRARVAAESSLAALTSQHAATCSELEAVRAELSVAQILHQDFEQSFQDSEAKRAVVEGQLATAQQSAAAAPAQPSAAQAASNAALLAQVAALREERATLQLALARKHSENESLSARLQSSASSELEPSPSPLSSEDASPAPIGFASSSSRPSASSASSGSGGSDRSTIDTSGQLSALGVSLRTAIDGLKKEVGQLESTPVATAAAALTPLVTSLDGDVTQGLTLLGNLQANLAESTDRELELMSKLQTITGTNIRVFCRVRPILPHELLEAREENLLQYPSSQQISIRTDTARKNRNSSTGGAPGHRGHTDSLPTLDDSHSSDFTSPTALASYTPFTFDKVFHPESGQAEVFEAVHDMILPVLNGYRACIFAYGQTGSGKTYTMGRMPEDDEVDSSSALTDPESHVGLTFRALQTLFRGIANRGSTYKYEVRITLLELYNEAWADLLVGADVGTAVSEDKDELASDGDEGETEEEPKSSSRTSGGASNGDKDSKGPRLTVRKGASGMYVDGAACRRVSNVGEVIALLQYGYKLRHVEATQLNEASSRSHLLLQVDVIGTNQATQVSSHGRLALVDLAGSERVKNSGVTGAGLKEACNINKSLSSLANVFIALSDAKPKHVPFRDSRLTFLLQDYFQGNSKTLMFVNISPASMHAGETLCSLQFAVRARQVKLNPGAGGASLDGWSSKYKGMLQNLQSSFATREKKYAATFKEQKSALKLKDTKIEALAAQVKQLSEQLAEAQRNFDRAENDRLRAVAAALPGGSTKDRRLEASEDKKWAALQSDLASAQSKAAEAKQTLERVQNEWKDKYAALETRNREATEKLRVQRLELAAPRPKGAFGSEPEAAAADENPGANEVAQLNRQVALLELEVKRLRIANRQTTAAASAASSSSSSTMLRSPTQRPRAASISTMGTSREPLAVYVPLVLTPSVDSAAEETPGADDEASASPAAVRSPQPAVRAPVARPAATAAGSSAAPSSLTSAKLAALQAQKRAQEAQSKPRSLLVGPRPIGASSSGSNLHSRTASQESIGGGSNGHGLTSNGLAALSESGSGAHNDLSSLKIEAGQSDHGSETSDTASVASLAASVTSNAGAPSAARPRRSGLVPPPTHSASAAAAVAAARVKLNAAKLAAAASGAAPAPRSSLVPPKPAVARVSLASGLRAPTSASAVSAAAPSSSAAAATPRSGLVRPKPLGAAADAAPAANGAKTQAAPTAARSMLRPPTGIPPPKAK